MYYFLTTKVNNIFFPKKAVWQLTTMGVPYNVQSAIESLSSVDKETVTNYIYQLHSKMQDAGISYDSASSKEDATPANDEQPFPPMYETGDDMDKVGVLKMEAADLKSVGDWEGALENYTAALLAAKPSSLLYANRATALLQLGRPRAAERDCNEALKENPDSAKALRVRGKALKNLGEWEAALKDLSASQQIDFDEGTVEDLKFLTEKHLDMEKLEADGRIKEETKLRQRSEEIKKARLEAKAEEEVARAAEAEAAGGGMPGGMGGMPGEMGGMPGGMGGMPGMPGGGGMPGGMGGMPGMPGGGGMPPGMGELFQDPEIMGALSNPKVMSALSGVMSGGMNPQKMQELMADPEVGPVMQKIMAKMGGGAGGMPFGGAGSAPAAEAGGDDIPDLDDLPDLE